MPLQVTATCCTAWNWILICAMLRAAKKLLHLAERVWLCNLSCNLQCNRVASWEKITQCNTTLTRFTCVAVYFWPCRMKQRLFLNSASAHHEAGKWTSHATCFRGEEISPTRQENPLAPRVAAWQSFETFTGFVDALECLLVRFYCYWWNVAAKKNLQRGKRNDKIIGVESYNDKEEEDIGVKESRMLVSCAGDIHGSLVAFHFKFVHRSIRSSWNSLCLCCFLTLVLNVFQSECATQCT